MKFGALLARCVAGLLVAGSLAQLGAAEPEEPRKLPPPDEKGVKRPAWPTHVLKADQVVRLNLPDQDRFDASALLRLPNGDLLTLRDKSPTPYRIQMGKQSPVADLIPLTNWFSLAQLSNHVAGRRSVLDCEGLAQDETGRVYLCEEGRRWIFRLDARREKVERLEIDWDPVKKYFSTQDRNASFEGIAVGGGRIYVANERQVGRIIAVDVETLKVVDDFSPQPFGMKATDVHYTDLSWHDGSLYALLRDSFVILKINPRTHQVLAEYNYRDVEKHPESAYFNLLPYGMMEGLAVDNEAIWLVTDNNGVGRLRAMNDGRPTLFRCARPDKP